MNNAVHRKHIYGEYTNRGSWINNCKARRAVPHPITQTDGINAKHVNKSQNYHEQRLIEVMILSLVINYLKKEEISVEFDQKLGVMKYKATTLDDEQGSLSDGRENEDEDKLSFE